MPASRLVATTCHVWVVRVGGDDAEVRPWHFTSPDPATLTLRTIIYRNARWFLGEPVVEAHRRFGRSTLGVRAIKRKKKPRHCA